MTEGYQLAYRLACEELASTDDIGELCRRSGASHRIIDSRKVITLDYIGRQYEVTVPDVEISLAGGEEEVSLVDQILILHYLLQAKGTPLSKEMIGYKHLPGGSVYFPTFSKRAIKPVVDRFGKEPSRLLGAAAALGGREAEYGDVAVTIDAFTRVPITFVLWRGDEEFPADGNILFDSTVSDYLTTDDINTICGIIAWKLGRQAQAAGPGK